MYDRKYDWSRVAKDSQFGKETPHDIRGTNVKKTLQWLHETQRCVSICLYLRNQHDFEELRSYLLLQVVGLNWLFCTFVRRI